MSNQSYSAAVLNVWRTRAASITRHDNMTFRRPDDVSNIRGASATSMRWLNIGEILPLQAELINFFENSQALRDLAFLPVNARQVYIRRNHVRKTYGPVR